MTKKDYDAAARWAEDEMELKSGSGSAVRGQAAAALGRELVERSRGGRPALDSDAARGEESPARQVRLPRKMSERVDALAKLQHRKPSEVMRDAIGEYLDAHKMAG